MLRWRLLVGALKAFLAARPTLFRLSCLALGALRRARAKRGRQRLVRRYLATHRVRKLQLGAGPGVLPGWLNTDFEPRGREVLFLDARGRFPFEDRLFDYVFGEHMIEHLAYAEGGQMLRECYRVLRPGGRLRLATPDLEVLAGLYAADRSPLQDRYIRFIVDEHLRHIGRYAPCFIINNALRNWGHQFLYDQATLRDSLARAGFVDIRRYGPLASDDEALRGLERHGALIGDEAMNAFESMVLEAQRPVDG